MKSSIFLLFMILLFTSCKKESSNPTSPTSENNVEGAIQTGTLVDLATQTIGSAGGTININKPGNALNGMIITIPSGSFSQTQSVKISSAEIKTHQLGQYFNPASPLIRITSGINFSNKTVNIKIPISLKANQFAMGFLYNEAAGKIQGIPLKELTADHITLAMKSFSSSTGQTLSKKYESDIITEIVIGLIDEDQLNEQTIISTGFKPGTDDWEFINFGSYAERGGICAGMSLTAMWYYSQRKNTDGALYHKYDLLNDSSVPGKFWWDNPKGYRFATAVQSDLSMKDAGSEESFQNNNSVLTWKCFALTMMINKEPQVVVLRHGVGHAVVAYQMNYKTGQLYVADPNFPNGFERDGTPIPRIIEFDGTKFKPFPASLYSGKGAINFDSIYYYGKEVMVNWDQIGIRWGQFEDGTIGNDKFPAYKFYLNTTTGTALADNYISPGDSLKVLCKSTDCKKFLDGTDHLQVLYVYDQNGTQLAKAAADNKGIAKFKLADGSNKIGFYICGAEDSTFENYVDFKWLTIYNPKLSIEPNPLSGNANKEYFLTAKSSGSLPPNATKYVWNFGDGTSEVTVAGSNTVKHTYTKEGVFTVLVKLYDNTTNKLITTTAATANMLSSLAGELASTHLAEIDFTGVVVFDKFYPNSTVNYYYQNPIINKRYEFNKQNLSWSGLSFSVNYSYKFVPYDGYTGQDTLTASGTINGSISQDGKSIANLTAHEKVTHKLNAAYTDITIVIHDIPYIAKTTIGCTTCQNYEEYWFSAPQPIANNIASLQMFEKREIGTNQYTDEMKTTSFNMSNLYVYLRKKL